MNAFVRHIPFALLLAATFSAQATIDPQPAPAASQRLEITAPRIDADAVLLSLRGADSVFEMSTGRRLVVTTYGEYLQLQYGKRSIKTLRHNGHGGFVSRDGQVSLQFELDARGDASLVRLTAPTDWL